MEIDATLYEDYSIDQKDDNEENNKY